MTVRVVVTDTHQRARDYLAREGLDPRRVRVVFDLHGAERLRGLELYEDEVVWLANPRSFPDVIRRLIDALSQPRVQYSARHA